MPDLALAWDLEAGCADLVLDVAGQDLETDEGLETAVLLSLFLDRRALDDDQVPGDPADRRGWWADEFLEVEGDRVGSRLWLLDRSKRTGDVAQQAEEYAREALAWLLEDRVASRIDVEVEIQGQALGIGIDIHRTGGQVVSLRFNHVWSGVFA